MGKIAIRLLVFVYLKSQYVNYPKNAKDTVEDNQELNQVIKRDLGTKNMLGRQASDEQLYMKRKDGGRGLKSLREVYEETRWRVGCYLFVSDNKCIKETWKQETRKECNLIKGTLAGLRQFLASESPLKLMKNAFCFISKSLFVLKTFKFLF